MGRRISFRELAQRFLIVCEGQETEPLYFRSFKVPGDVRSIKVQGLGKNTVSLVKEAISLKKKDEYDQVWCVFDVEDYCQEQVNKAISLAIKNHIGVAYSNQAFELWFLLHFHYYNTSIDRKEYVQKLTKHLGFEYCKNSPGLYGRLFHLQGDAIRNAKLLFAQYEPPNPCQDDPCTTVFQLVEKLNRFTPDSRRNPNKK